LGCSSVLSHSRRGPLRALAMRFRTLMLSAPAPEDLVWAPLGQNPGVARGGVSDDTLQTTVPQENTEVSSTTPQPPSPEQPLPTPMPFSQAQCRDGGFVAFGFEKPEACPSLLATQGKQEPRRSRFSLAAAARSPSPASARPTRSWSALCRPRSSASSTSRASSRTAVRSPWLVAVVRGLEPGDRGSAVPG
jgi:hypothetical protein